MVELIDKTKELIHFYSEWGQQEYLWVMKAASVSSYINHNFWYRGEMEYEHSLFMYGKYEGYPWISHKSDAD